MQKIPLYYASQFENQSRNVCSVDTEVSSCDRLCVAKGRFLKLFQAGYYVLVLSDYTALSLGL